MQQIFTPSTTTNILKDDCSLPGGRERVGVVDPPSLKLPLLRSTFLGRSNGAPLAKTPPGLSLLLTCGESADSNAVLLLQCGEREKICVVINKYTTIIFSHAQKSTTNNIAYLHKNMAESMYIQ